MLINQAVGEKKINYGMDVPDVRSLRASFRSNRFVEPGWCGPFVNTWTKNFCT